MDLLEQTVPDLKRLALHTIRRDHNWSSQISSIEWRRSKRLKLGRDHTIIHQIPGTSLLVVHSEQRGTATCYNVDTELALHSVHVGHSVFHFSLAVRRNNAHLIAFLVTEDLAVDFMIDRPTLLVLAVYGDRRIEISFRRDLETGFKFGQLFLNTRVVGMLRAFDTETLDVVAFNLTNGACKEIHTDTLYDSQMGAYLDHDLYIVKDRNANSSNNHCSGTIMKFAFGMALMRHFSVLRPGSKHSVL
ncbi:hypothetical protein DFH09DRAFT_531011 [Mycena vulgaris]|nr:hypothetical protein DFH09DRAFT_531011 [Mycena vulgaris]